MSPIYIALVHYPVVNKHGEIVTTSVTNFDIHDLARTSATYGVQQCFFVTPNLAQQHMLQYIHDYWREGFGAEYNPDRKEAFSKVRIATDISQTCLTIKKAHGTEPKVFATTAKKTEKPLSFKELKDRLDTQQPVLLLFGTGWGLAPELLEKVDGILEPIVGPTDYNHLPVRSAVAVVLDRLLGVKS